MTLRHLAEAEAFVAQGERHIAEQRARIGELERDGHDTQEANALLVTFDDSQRLHVEHRDRLLKELWDAQRT